MRAVILSFAMLISLIGTAEADEDSCIPLSNASPEMLAWLKGEWTNQTGRSKAQQSWSAPINGILVGHEIIATAGATSFSFLRITRTPHGLSMFVSINGAKPFEFTATELCSAHVVFQGDTTGYPSRIVYLNSLISTAAREKVSAEPVAERRFLPRFPEPLM